MDDYKRLVLFINKYKMLISCLKAIGKYCFPFWFNDEDESDKEKKIINDPQAASDSFRQGERYLFSLQDIDLESGGTQNSLMTALEKFEDSRNFGGTKGAAVAGIFYECAISMSKPDYKKAYKYYEEAAEQGDTLAMCLIASFPQRVECGSIPGDFKHRKQLLKDVTNPAFVSASQDPLKWLKEAADKHRLGEAIYLLGSCIEQGVGFRKADSVTAVGLYREAANAGVKAARRALAKCYLFGSGIEKDVSAGKYWLIKAIKDNNDPEAMALLAMNYENGVFPPEENDYQEFTDLKHSNLQQHVAKTPNIHISQSINLENAPAVEEKNEEDFEHVKWSSGPGTEIIQRVDKPKANRNERRDYRECFYWAKRSADMGCASGFYQLARCYEVGIGVAIDLEQCVGLYRTAIDLGYAPAQFSLACFYCSGCVVEKRDTEKAHELLSGAAESGYTPAMISLATLYTLESKTHTRVVESEPTNRFRDSLTTSLIKLRDPKTVALTIYDENLKKAMVWWRRAAKRGSRQAQYELALCFRDGRGVEVNLAKALYWMRQAAEAGLPEAQLELGVLLVQDLPVKGNNAATSLEHDNESFYWILRAAKNGLPEAQIELAQLFVEGRYVHKNPSTAFYWFKRAAKAGHPYAQYRVGTMLLDGEVTNGCVGSQGSQAEAVKWLKLASEQGWTDSDKLLPVALGMANEESVKTYRKEGKYIY